MVHLDAIAEGVCPVCLEEVRDETVVSHSSIQCGHEHSIHTACLSAQVKSYEDLRELRDRGLQCPGGGAEARGGRCAERISLAKIRQILSPEDRGALDERLEKSARPGDHHWRGREVERLRNGIERAFNICCPKEGCGATLGAIEGCNAATCSSESCESLFCYLCLQEQEGKDEAHAHVIGHSGDYWERRTGYVDRYHWLIARKNLAHLFSERVDSEIRSAALALLTGLLTEKKMWPFPAGALTGAWTQEVKESSLSHLEKVELFQNEFIYRRQIGDGKSAARVREAIEEMHGKVLASLDVRDAGGVDAESAPTAPRVRGPGPRPEAGAEVRPAPIPDVRAQVLQEPRQEVRPEARPVPVPAPAPAPASAPAPVPMPPPPRADLDDGIGPVVDAQPMSFARFGQMFRVGNLVWSGVVPGVMTYPAAVQFCSLQGFGSRLPTIEEYEKLARALGKNTLRGYNPLLVAPDLVNRVFWSATQNPMVFNTAVGFNGSFGVPVVGPMLFLNWVRCVR